MQSPLRVIKMSSVLSMLLVMIIFPFGRSQTLSSCLTEMTACFSDDVCESCATLFQGLIESGSIDTNITSCPDFYVEVCSEMDTDECDVTNEYMLDFAGCIFEEEYGCSGFTTCEDASGNVTTAVPTAAPTAAPTDVPNAAPTAAPTAAQTAAPTDVPNAAPMAAPTDSRTATPTAAPIDQPQDDAVFDGDGDDSGASTGVTASATATLLGTLAALFMV